MTKIKTMILKKTVYMLVAALLIHGCTASNNYYMLSMPKQPTRTYMRSDVRIGVEKVSVPNYFSKRQLAVVKSSSQISFIESAVWAEDMNAGLTSRLIGFLQKKFRQPEVYAYPWDTDKQPDVKVKVQVTRFIAQGDRVYLDANWEVENMRTQKRIAKLFSTSVVTNSDASSIVDAMHRAFGELEEDIAKGLYRF